MRIKTVILAMVLSITSSSILAETAPETDIFPYRQTSFDKNDMQIINNGIAGLFARIDLIRRAKKTIDVEYFIFNPDTSGRIIIKELVKATERGVKVRILVDKSKAVFKLDEYYAQVLKEHNIEIRYYNSAFFLRISSVQFRNHRKLFVIDSEEAITGGRNIADEYFNLSKKFNFLDRDIWIQGELVKTMQATFNLYWNSDIVQKPKAVIVPVKTYQNNKINGVEDNSYELSLESHMKKLSEAKKIVAENAEDNKTLDYVLDFGQRELNKTNKYRCPEAVFATDREGASFIERLDIKNYNKNYRLLRKEISKWMGKIDDEITLDSPYFLNDSNSLEIVNNLLAKNTKITILTNSLNSTDAIYVSTVFTDTVKKYTPNENFNAYTYKGTFSNESELMNDEIKNASWGTHSKTIVYNNNSFMVGTFNIDNRSNFYNTEMALFCSGSPELTNEILSNIKIRMKNSHHLNSAGRPDDGSDILEGASLTKKLLYFMLKIPASLAQFLM